MGAAPCPVVRWRQDKHFLQLPGPPSFNLATQQGGTNLGRRARRHADVDVSATAPAGLSLRECVKAVRSPEGRPRRALHAVNTGVGNIDVGVRQDWRYS